MKTIMEKWRYECANSGIDPFMDTLTYLTSLGLSGAGFQESMSGDCSCTVLN